MNKNCYQLQYRPLSQIEEHSTFDIEEFFQNLLQFQDEPMSQKVDSLNSCSQNTDTSEDFDNMLNALNQNNLPQSVEPQCSLNSINLLL